MRTRPRLSILTAWLAASATALGPPLAGCGDEAEPGPSYTVEGALGEATPMGAPAWVPVVEAEVTGARGDFLVDTGAPATLIDRDFAAGFTPPPAREGVNLVDLAAFGVRFLGLEGLVYDLFGSGERVPVGIVGSDILAHHVLWLDYRGLVVRLYADWDGHAPPHQADDAAAPLLLDADREGGGRALVPGDCGGAPCGTIDLPATRVLVRAQLEGGEPAWVMIDTGASSIIMSESQLERLGDREGRPRLDGVTVTTATGLVTAAYSRLSTLSLGAGTASVTLEDQPILVLPDNQLLQAISDEVGRPVVALIGGTFLRHYQVTVDARGGVLGLARYQRDDHVPPDEYVGFGFTLYPSGARWLVGDVYLGTSAAEAGIGRDDEVFAIGGTSLTGLSREAVDALIAGYTLGDVVEVDRQGGIVSVRVEDLLPSYRP